MNSSNRPGRDCIHGRWYAVACIGLLLNGCTGSRSEEVAWLECRVLIDGQPAQDVRVTLTTGEASDDNGFELVGITDPTGIASMKLTRGSIPSATQLTLRASLESLGDWVIQKPWSEPEQSPLQLTWNGTESPLEIHLPRKAVRSL